MDILTILLIVLLLWFIFDNLPLIVGLLVVLAIYIMLTRSRRL